MRYEFHPEAELELYEAALRYETEVTDLGRRFGDEVERVVRLLLGHPELGASVDETLRDCVVGICRFGGVYGVWAGVV
jgi:plasmid stabilization system protein ParE